MANLYNLTAQYKALEEMLEQYPCDEELALALAQIEDDLETKADNYAKVIANLTADAEAITGEIERLTARKRGIDNSVRRLKESLMTSMKETGKQKFKTELFSFGIQKNGGKAPLKVTATIDELPEEFRKVTVEPDNAKIREYIEQTGDLEYGYFEERGESLRIR